MKSLDFEIVIIGAGMAGISTAYYLSENFNKHNIAIVDPLAPMSFTSAHSGENYRNWWPHSTMTAFTNHSIDLMEQISVASDNVFNMTRRGYALTTRNDDIDELISRSHLSLTNDDMPVRYHQTAESGSYQAPLSADWQTAPSGVDILSNQNLIRRTFASYSDEIKHVVHIRRAGDISSQQLGQYMLEKVKSNGGQLIQAKVCEIDHGKFFKLTTDHDSIPLISCEKLVNAAGPFVNHVAGLLDLQLPIHNVLQQKIAFDDREHAIPRDMPFSIDLDECSLDWDSEERELLAADDELAWLAQPIEGNIHCRPDGGDKGSWVKLGWAFNHEPCQANWQPQLYDQYPEIVLRGAAHLNPGLKKYYGRFPRAFKHYGGFYPMTQENWPLIGPMDIEGVYIVGALSGFGTMAACAAGELAGKWITDQRLPEYAADLSLERYSNSELIDSLRQASEKGLL